MIDNKKIPLLLEIENIYQKLKEEALILNYGYAFMDEVKVFEMVSLYKEAFDNYDKQITKELENKILSEIRKEIDQSIRYENGKLFLSFYDKKETFFKEDGKLTSDSGNNFFNFYSIGYVRHIITKVFSQLSGYNKIKEDDKELLFEKLLKNWLVRVGKPDDYIDVNYKNLQNIRKLFKKHYHNSFYDHIINQHLYGLNEGFDTFLDSFSKIIKKDFSSVDYLSSAYYDSEENENIESLNKRETSIYFNSMLSTTDVLSLYDKEDDNYEHLVDEKILHLIEKKEILFPNYSKMATNIHIKAKLYFLRRVKKVCAMFLFDNFDVKIEMILNKKDLLMMHNISFDKINNNIEICAKYKEYNLDKNKKISDKMQMSHIFNIFSQNEMQSILTEIDCFNLSNHIERLDILKNKINNDPKKNKVLYNSFSKWYTDLFFKENLNDIKELVKFMNYIWNKSREKTYKKINIVNWLNNFNGDIFVQSINEQLISNITTFIIKNNNVNNIDFLIQKGVNPELIKEMLTEKWGNKKTIDPEQKNGETWFDICFNHSLFYLLEDLIKRKEIPTFETNGNNVSTLKSLLLNNKTTTKQIDMYLNYLKEINKLPDFCDVLIRLKNEPMGGSHRLDHNYFENKENTEMTIKKCLYCQEKYGISFFKYMKENIESPLGKYHESFIAIKHPEFYAQLKLLGFNDVIEKIEKEKKYVRSLNNINLKEIKDNIMSGLNILDCPMSDYSENDIYQDSDNLKYIEMLYIKIKNKNEFTEEKWKSLFGLITKEHLSFIEKEEPQYGNSIIYHDITSLFLNNFYYFDGIDEIAQKFLEYCVYDLKYTPSQKITYNNPKYSLIIDMLLKNRDKQELYSIIVNKNNIGIEKKKRL